MNDIFDIRRFGAFALSCYKEVGVKKLSLYWGILFLWMCIPLGEGFYLDSVKDEYISTSNEHLGDLFGAYTQVCVDSYRNLLFIIVFFSTLFYSWKFFGNIKLKRTWLLPVSKFEKLSFVALNALVVNVVIVTILSYGAVSVASRYEYVALQKMADVSVEEIQEYGDDIEWTEYKGVTYRKIYPEFRFVDFFTSPASLVYGETITDEETSRTYHYDITTNEWFLLFFMFAIALWIGVSPINKSRWGAFLMHFIGFALLSILVVHTVYSGHKNFYNLAPLNLFNETGGVFELVIASKIYYLFPFIYLWISWRKIKTMQINQGRGVMKRYDLLLLELYLIASILIVVGGNLYSSKKQNASDYFIDLKGQSIKAVVIENTRANLTVVKREDRYIFSYDTKQKIKGGIFINASSSGGSSGESNMEHLEFKFKGDISLLSASSFRIEQDTLFIGEANTGERGLELHICKHIKVDTLNAPNVTIVNK